MANMCTFLCLRRAIFPVVSLSVVLQHLRQNRLKLMESFECCMERGFFVVHCLFARRKSNGVKRMKVSLPVKVHKCDTMPRNVTSRILLAGRHALAESAFFVPKLFYAHSPTFDGPSCLFPQYSDCDTGCSR